MYTQDFALDNLQELISLKHMEACNQRDAV